MQVQTYLPHPALADFVRVYISYQFNVEQPIERLLCAKKTGGLIFPFKQPCPAYYNYAGSSTYTKKIVDSPTLQGPSSVYGTGFWEGEQNLVVVVMKPVGTYHFARASSQQLSNVHYSLDDINLTGIFAEAQDRLWSVESGPAAVALLEPYLLRCFDRAINLFRENDITCVTRFIEGHHGLLPIASVAKKFRITPRGLEKQFLMQVGHTPKMFSRLCRFRAGLQTILKQPDISWFDLVETYNYTDQAHFIRDFHDFAGQTPRQFFQAHPMLQRIAEEKRDVFAFLQ